MKHPETEQEILERFVAEKGIRRSKSRSCILRVFLGIERHVTAAELHEQVRKECPTIGIATVYRALKLFVEAGLAREVDFGDGTARYEHHHRHEHHDHLVCVKCGSYVEAMDPRIEELQQELAARHGFVPQSHSLRIFGICKKCRRS